MKMAVQKREFQRHSRHLPWRVRTNERGFVAGHPASALSEACINDISVVWSLVTVGGGGLCWRSVIKTSKYIHSLIFITVVPCMLFQSLLYCSNSCTLLHFKILKSHTKTLKIRPYMFRSPLKPSSGGPWPYFARTDIQPHIDTLYNKCKSTFQFSNLAKYGH
jgi:hypothetical protein